MKKILLLASLVLAPFTAGAEEFDLELGEEIYETCAPCHGPFGQGGGGGVYPRLAGMDWEYVAYQLEKFKSRERENIPMIPFANDRELPEEDVEAVSGYIMSLELQTRLPETEGDIDGYTRLLQAKQVLNIPRHPDGDEELGAKAYGEFCSKCHGKVGEGTIRAPLLAGQHIPYMKKTLEDYRDGLRRHRKLDELITPRTPEEIDSIFTFLSLQDDNFVSGKPVEK